MKIIKHGSIYIEPQTVKCYCCGCEFEIEDSDVDKTYLPYDERYLCKVNCPECNKSIIIKELRS